MNHSLIGGVLITNIKIKVMDTKERHIKENESNEKREIREASEGYESQIANGLKAHSKNHRNDTVRKNNRLWIWLGVLFLIFILLWWLFSIGTFDALIGTANG